MAEQKVGLVGANRGSGLITPILRLPGESTTLGGKPIATGPR